MKPWPLITAITSSKEPLLDDVNENELKAYPKYIINIALSHYVDCIFDINELNQYPELDSKMHFDYLLHALSKKKRYTEWIKPEKSEHLSMVKEFFHYGNLKAKEALKILTVEQLLEIKKLMQAV